MLALLLVLLYIHPEGSFAFRISPGKHFTTRAALWGRGASGFPPSACKGCPQCLGARRRPPRGPPAAAEGPPEDRPDMYDVADDLDLQRQAVHSEILQLLEEEEDARQARRAGSRAPHPAACLLQTNSSSSSSNSSRRVTLSSRGCRPFRFPLAGEPQSPEFPSGGPGAFLSAFDHRNPRGGLGSKEPPSVGASGGLPTLEAALEALEGLALGTPLRGEELQADSRFAALLHAVDLGLRHALLQRALRGPEAPPAQQQQEARRCSNSSDRAFTSNSSSSSTSISSWCVSKSSSSRGSSSSKHSSSSSCALPPQQLCRVAHALARLRLRGSDADALLRSLVFLGMHAAREFSMRSAFVFLLSLSAAATNSYQPIQRPLLKAFRGPWTSQFLEALAAASSSEGPCSNATDNKKSSSCCSNKADGSNSTEQMATTNSSSSKSSSSGSSRTGDYMGAAAALSLPRLLLLLLPLFVSVDVLGRELAACLQAASHTAEWATALTAASPRELTAAAAAAAASPALQGDCRFWGPLAAAAERRGPSLPPLEAISLCESFTQVGIDFGALLLAAQKPLLQQASFLPASAVCAAANLVAAACSRHPRLQQLLQLLQQQLQQRAENA
ncbi:hypothetical protein Efla_000496 [Eimeria flavescens]